MIQTDEMICPVCHRGAHQDVVSWYSGGTEWCEAGMSGAHLIHLMSWTCDCGWLGPRLTKHGRYCIDGCDWSMSTNERQVL